MAACLGRRGGTPQAPFIDFSVQLLRKLGHYDRRLVTEPFLILRARLRKENPKSRGIVIAPDVPFGNFEHLNILGVPLKCTLISICLRSAGFTAGQCAREQETARRTDSSGADEQPHLDPHVRHR
jgi:hypothetical protein